MITYGDPETGAYCSRCQAPTRLRLPVFADGRPAGGLEICPGCGTGHDRPAAYAIGPPDAPEPPEPPPVPLYERLTARLRREDHGTCERAHCARKARRTAYDWDDGYGTAITYWFCRRAHRAAWCKANGLPQP